MTKFGLEVLTGKYLSVWLEFIDETGEKVFCLQMQIKNACWIKRNMKKPLKTLKEGLNNTTETTDATDGENWRRLKRIEIRVFENCSA